MSVNRTNNYSKLIFTFLQMTLFHQPGFLQRLRQSYSSSQSVVFINVIQLALKVVLSNT
ncbi:hypothetical protein LCAZH_0445 [Lacticaseibacillus paracasei]|nr:hypothetical protein LCAZH_0445 [Lacticaseibacillus paracasei]